MNVISPSYNYSMENKYTGCNIVESVVRRAQKPEVKKTPQHSVIKLFILRLVIAAVMIGFIAALHFFPNLAGFSSVKSALKNVFCYDVFGRISFGIAI